MTKFLFLSFILLLSCSSLSDKKYSVKTIEESGDKMLQFGDQLRLNKRYDKALAYYDRAGDMYLLKNDKTQSKTLTKKIEDTDTQKQTNKKSRTIASVRSVKNNPTNQNIPQRAKLNSVKEYWTKITDFFQLSLGSFRNQLPKLNSTCFRN